MNQRSVTQCPWVSC